MRPDLQISRTADRALEEFSDEFREALALGAIEPWAEKYGLVRSSDALKTTFPIPLDAAGYREFKGDMKFRSLYHRSLTMTMKTWQDGVEAFAAQIEAPDFSDWLGAPAAIATEWMRQPNVLVADMLASGSLAGPLLDLYRDPDTDTASTRRLFAADHPFNVLKPSLGDFDNRLQTTVADIQSGAFFDAANDHFRSIMGPNGKPMGLRMFGGSLLVPSTRDSLFKKTLEHDSLIRAVEDASDVVAAVTQNNIYKGTISYDVSDELEDQDHFYAIAAPKPGLVPWILQKQSSVEEIVFDKQSDFYKRSLKVALSYIGRMNVAAALPHPIARVEITG